MRVRVRRERAGYTYEEMGRLGLEGEMKSSRVEKGEVVDVDIYCGGRRRRRGTFTDMAMNEESRMRGDGMKERVMGGAVVYDELDGAGMVVEWKERLFSRVQSSFM